jgi:phospholipid/cholesterol/gamma-HCH transport system substrate-binding protein
MSMKQFSERNPVVIAVTGTIAMVLIFLGTFNSSALPVIGGGQTYQARFAEAGGLSTNSEVRIAGVRVGEVTDIGLDGREVVVTFKVKDAWLGDRTTASIELKTLLGQKFLALRPEGEERLEAGDTIPLARTTVPYDMSTAMDTFTETMEEIDVDQLADSFRVLADSFRDTPEDVQVLVAGLSELALAVADNDTELARLMTNTREVTGQLAGVDAELARFLEDGDALFTALAARREAITDLLRGTRKLARAIAGIIADNQEQIQPALRKLDRVSRLLSENREQLDVSITRLAQYYSMLSDAYGTGPWLDGYI